MFYLIVINTARWLQVFVTNVFRWLCHSCKWIDGYWKNSRSVNVKLTKSPWVLWSSFLNRAMTKRLRRWSPKFKTFGWLQGQPSLASFRGRSNEHKEPPGDWVVKSKLSQFGDHSPYFWRELHFFKKSRVILTWWHHQ